MKVVGGTGGNAPSRRSSAVFKLATVCGAGVERKSCGSSFS
jgi:hypothetical protein